MKVFAMIRKILPFIGLLDFNPNKRQILTTILIGLTFGLIIYGIASEVWFIAFEARAFDEYAKASGALIIATYAFMVSTAIQFRQGNMEHLFGAMETFFKKRKWWNLFGIAKRK